MPKPGSEWKFEPVPPPGSPRPRRGQSHNWVTYSIWTAGALAALFFGNAIVNYSQESLRQPQSRYELGYRRYVGSFQHNGKTMYIFDVAADGTSGSAGWGMATMECARADRKEGQVYIYARPMAKISQNLQAYKDYDFYVGCVGARPPDLRSLP